MFQNKKSDNSVAAPPSVPVRKIRRRKKLRRLSEAAETLSGPVCCISQLRSQIFEPNKSFT